MAKIKVNPSGMLVLSNLMQREVIQPMEDVEQSIVRVLADLDMEVASSEGIRTELSSLRQRSANETAQLSGLRNALDSAVNAFSSADKRLSEQASELTYLMQHASLQAIVGRIKEGILALFGIVGVNAAFGITEEGYSTIETAMGMIRGFLDAEAARAGRVSAAGEALYQYLQENDPWLLFGQYSFAVNFMNDVSPWDVMGYSLREWKDAFWAMVTGGSIEGAAEAFLDDPDTCKAILRGIIDDLSGTEYLDVFSGSQEEALGIIGDLAEMGGYDGVNDFIDSLTEMVGDAETADKILKDYSANIARLESLKDVAPDSGMLTEVVDDLLKEYKNQASSMLFDDLKGKFEAGVVNLADYALGLNIGAVDGVIQTVLGDVDSLNALDTVLYSTEMRCNAVTTFQVASQKIMSGNFTAQDLTAYQNPFDLVKALTIEQYEAMYSYYDKGSMEAKYLENQLEQLKDMSYTNFNYAQTFSSFKESYGNGGGSR